MTSSDVERVHREAIRLFRSGIAQNPFVQNLGLVERPIPVSGPESEIASWFVGITIEDRLVGFMQFDTDLRLMRYSTFQRQASSIEDCPKKKTWLDPAYIKERARSKASPEDKLSPPYLTYDRSPSRIVWAVKAENRNGHARTIYVAGDFVYLPSQSERSTS